MSHRTVALGIGIGVRLFILAVLGDALLNPDAPRYEGKAIGVRGLVILPAMLLVPAVHFFRGRRERYPAWTDVLYLSIFATDLAGNLFDLFDTYRYFDLVPHFHGTGAITLVAAQLLGVSGWAAIGVAQATHVLLEAQEYWSDVLFGLRNVRGTWDTVNDLVAGLAGSLVYVGLWAWRRRDAGWLSRRR